MPGGRSASPLVASAHLFSFSRALCLALALMLFAVPALAMPWGRGILTIGLVGGNTDFYNPWCCRSGFGR